MLQLLPLPLKEISSINKLAAITSDNTEESVAIFIILSASKKGPDT